MFSTNLSDTFLALRIEQDIKNVYWSSVKITRYSCRVSIKRVFSRPTRIFEKRLNIRFHENPSSDSRVVPCGRTDGQEEKTKLILAFRYFTREPKTGKVAAFHISISKLQTPNGTCKILKRVIVNIPLKLLSTLMKLRAARRDKLG
jgi:hypothetical protein